MSNSEHKVGVAQLPVSDDGMISWSLWITFVLCLLSNVFAGIVSTIMAAYLPVIVSDLTGNSAPARLTDVSSWISVWYVVGWALGGFTWGFVTDKLGRSKSFALAVGCYGLFTVFIGLASSWEMVMGFRFLSGFAVGGLMVITPTLLSEIWPARSRSIIMGIDSVGFPIGIFSSGLITYLVSDWRAAFMIGVAPCLVAIIGILLLHESDRWKDAIRQKTDENVFSSSDKANLVRGSVIFGSMLIGLWALFSWIPTWVQSLLHNSDGQAERGMTMMLLGAGGLTGGFFSGWISNKINVHKAMLMCFAGCFVMSFLLFGMNNSFSPLIYAEAAALSLSFGVSQGLLSIYIPQLFPYHIRATATGICFNAGRLFTAAGILSVASLVDGLGGYGHALLAFSLVFVAGFLTIHFTKESSIQKQN